jgi:hypothetical protein
MILINRWISYRHLISRNKADEGYAIASDWDIWTYPYRKKVFFVNPALNEKNKLCGQ